MGSLQFPVQRWFGVDSGERQQSELDRLEIRIRELEKAYGLLFGQSAESSYAPAFNIATPAAPGFHDTGVPPITVEIPNESSIVLVYMEATVWNDTSGTMELEANLFSDEGSSGGSLGFGNLAAGVTQECVTTSIKSPFGIMDGFTTNPRGGQVSMVNFPVGTHTFSLKWSVTALNASKARFNQQYLAIDVL